MSSATDSPEISDYPFATLLRASDRAQILCQVIQSVWDTALGLPVLPREGDERRPADAHDTIVGSVRITGAWEGVVAMSCPAWLATECSALMYGREARALTEAEIRDGWGELVNMVGGHIKALVPPLSRLALPVVGPATGADYRETDCKVLNEMTFACQGNRMRVTVLKRV
jgi:chemotaxis protein CheX